MPDALIVAHGAPSEPAPQEAAMQALAARVAALLPRGWRVRGATLAAAGSFEAALAGMTAPVVYPFFMAEGWFTGIALPRRLAAAGAATARQLAPLGVDPGLPAIAARVALGAAAAADLPPARTALLIAAHGSQVSTSSAASAHSLVASLGRTTPFRRVVCGFVEQAPLLADAARGLGPALCLPFFALNAGHVLGDVPQALAAAGFTGPLLPPLGADPAIPALIAAAIRRGAGPRG